MATEARGARGPAFADRLGASSSTETKAAFRTTEFIAYLAVLVGLLVAGAITGNDNGDSFNADEVWLYATLLTIGYMISRGLAKSGSRDPYTEDGDQHRG